MKKEKPLYKGVKFKTEIIEKKIPKDPRIKELKEWGKIFNEMNFAPPLEGGSAGNLGFRKKQGEDKFIITCSGVEIGNLKDDCFAEVESCDFETGEVRARSIENPSSESMMYWAILNKRKDINAIFHGHGEEIMNNIDKLEVPETEEEEPYGTIELVNRVLDIVDKGNFLIMKNHGFIALGKTVEEAGELTLKMHKKCINKDIKKI